MKQKDIMQPSVLQQNMFFENLPEEDITQYQLKRPSQKKSFITGANIKEKGRRKQRETQSISSFMTKLSKESLTVKLQIGNVGLDNQVNFNNDKQSFQIPLDDQKSMKKIESYSKEPQNDIPQQSFVEIIGFQQQKASNEEVNEQKVQTKKRTPQLIDQNQSKQICYSIDQQVQQKQDKSLKLNVRQTVGQQKRKSVNLCLAFDDSDSDKSDVQGSKQKPSQNENKKSQKKKKLKKINYLNKKPNRISSNQLPSETICSQQEGQKKFNKYQTPKLQDSSSKELQESSKSQSKAIKIQKETTKTQKSKKSLLVMNFESQENDQSGKQSSLDQQFDTMIELPKAIQKNSHQTCQQNTNENKKSQIQLPNSNMSNNQNKIILNDFDDDEQSSSNSSESLTNANPILLKPSSIDSSNSISQNDEQINFTRPINILQFLRMIPTLKYVYEPIPPNCVFQSIIKRYHGPNENNLTYEMFDYSTYKSILKVRNVQEGFQIFSSEESLNASWSGKSKTLPQSSKQTSCALLRSNFFGTQFNCFKFNRNNQKPENSKLNRLITINYETNLFGLNGPRRMKTYIPGANYLIRGEKNLQQAYESEKKLSGNEPTKIECFVNKKPKWNNEISSFVLNFNGRATVSSVKNFIITRPTDDKKDKQSHDNLVLFGKMEKNVFNLDIKYPFNLVQGLALALSSFDKKIACE